MDAAHAKYLEATGERASQFETLSSKDRQSANQMSEQARKLARLHDSLAHWRLKLATEGSQRREQNKAMREEKETISRHFNVRAQKIKKSASAAAAGAAI